MTSEERKKFNEIVEKLLLQMMDESPAKVNSRIQDTDAKTVIHIHQHFHELIISLLYLLNLKNDHDHTSQADTVTNKEVEELNELINQITQKNRDFAEKAKLLFEATT